MSDPLYFASGSSMLPDIQGFLEIGHPLGVAIPHVTEEGMVALCQAQVPVFVDSGAFSEVKFTREGPTITAPISREDWASRLDKYTRLAESLGPLAYLVAPDCVGFQDITLLRLRRHGARVRKLLDLGAQVLVPLQQGRLTTLEFYREVLRVLRCFDPPPNLVPAFPMKKGATPLSEVEDFLTHVKPVRVHMLGLGVRNKLVRPLSEMLKRVAPEVQVSFDSCLIRSSVGKTNGPGGGPRALTKHRDATQEEFQEVLWQDPPPDSPDRGDYTDELTTPSGWMTPKEICSFISYVGLTTAEGHDWLDDPDGFLQKETDGVPWYEDPRVEAYLNACWEKHHDRATAPDVQRCGIVKAFGPERKGK